MTYRETDDDDDDEQAGNGGLSREIAQTKRIIVRRGRGVSWRSDSSSDERLDGVKMRPKRRLLSSASEEDEPDCWASSAPVKMECNSPSPEEQDSLPAAAVGVPEGDGSPERKAESSSDIFDHSWDAPSAEQVTRTPPRVSNHCSPTVSGVMEEQSIIDHPISSHF